MTAPERTWLGWDGPVLERASAWIMDRCAEGAVLDLSSTLVVTPVSRAGRWLEGMLVDLCAQRGVLLTPPTFTTLSRVSDTILRGNAPPDEICTLAWCRAVGRERGALFEGDPSAWAGALQRTSDALAAAGLRFEDAHKRASMVDDASRERLERCVRIERCYLDILRAHGMCDTLQSADSDALEVFERCVLVAPTELGALGRTLIDRACASVTSLVAAPNELAHRFDGWGCPIPSEWAEARLPVASSSIRFASDARDQAHAAWECIGSVGNEIDAKGVVIGAMDSASASALAHVASERGVSTRDAGGRGLAMSPIASLLEALRAHVQERTLASLRRLCGHPDVERAVGGARWLERLDAYAGRTQLGRVPDDLGEWPRPTRWEKGLFESDLKRVMALIGPLLTEEDDGVGAHTLRFVEFLRALYAERGFDERREEDRLVRAGLEYCAQCARSFAEIDERCSCEEAIALVASGLAARAVALRPDERAVELLGWLELATDPAPVCVVCDVSEGRVPASVGLDPLLPEALRSALGLATGASRAGRDAYLMALLASSKERVFFVSPAQTEEGDPLVPSRLLFRADDDAVLDRVARATGEGRDRLRTVSLEPPDAIAVTEQGFGLKPITKKPALERWSVTSFRRYLASPYAFYVERVLRRSDGRAHRGELDAGGFGDLLHDALHRFGRDEEMRTLTDAEQVSSALGTCLQDSAFALHGADPPRAVWIQIAQALRRLRAFAPAQAAWAQEGWEIVETEWSPDGGVEFEIPGGEPVLVSGVIDRLDRRRGTDEWAVIDYKSSASGKGPEKTHRVRGEWRDVQLPMYRRLAAPLGIGRVPTMAFGVLSPEIAKTRMDVAGWGEDDLAEAESWAHWVVRSVREGSFDDVGRESALHGAVRELVGLGMIEGESEQEDAS